MSRLWTDRLRTEAAIQSGDNRKTLLDLAARIETATAGFITARTPALANQHLTELNKAWKESITQQARIAGSRPTVKV